MADRALGDAPQEQASDPAEAMCAHRDQIVATLLGGRGDHLRRRALHELDVDGVPEAPRAGDDLLGLRLGSREHRIAHR